MANLVLGIVFILINLSLLILFYKLFGKTGLFVWVAIATIIANIQVNKTIEVIGLTATLGNTIYGSIFLATDILNEKYSSKDANKSVLFGFASAVIMVITMSLTLLFTPASSDYANDALVVLFQPSYRIVAASLLAYLASQLLDIKLFNFIKLKLPGNKYLWIRNNIATILSQAIDTVLFVTIAFLFTYSSEILFEIFITTLLFKIIVAIIDTPFLYLSKIIKPLKD